MNHGALSAGVTGLAAGVAACSLIADGWVWVGLAVAGVGLLFILAHAFVIRR